MTRESGREMGRREASAPRRAPAQNPDEMRQIACLAAALACIAAGAALVVLGLVGQGG